MNVKSQAKAIIRFAKPYKWTLTNLFICVVVTSFVGMLYPYVFGKLVDEVFYRQNKDAFLEIILVYVIIYICEQSMHLILNATWAYLMTRFLFDIRHHIFNKMLSLRADWFTRTRTGDAVTLINKDADEVMNLIHWNIFYLFANFLRLVTAVVLIVLMNFYIALLMFVVVPLSVYITMIFGAYVKRKLETYRTRYGHVISWVFEMLNGLRDIQLLAGERNVTKRFVHLWASLIPLKVQKSQLELTSNRVTAFISLCSDLTLYIVSVYFILKGTFTVGGFIATIEYFSRANALLNNLSTANSRFQQNRVSIRRIFDLWNEPEEEKAGKALVVREGKVHFHNVSFHYVPGTNVLNEVSLTVHPYEKIAIAGESGAGKTTLIQLLLRYYEPVNGAIYIDDENLKNISISSLRRNIGVVMQNPVIFDDTLRASMLLAKRHATDEEIHSALRKAQLGEFVESLPEGLDTVLGERGRAVSGGQKQRIAIARMFLRDPKILILDEATSALDMETEALVEKALDELSRQRTTIVIAHRISSILKADKIAFLHGGKIVAIGKHKDLMMECEPYHKMFSNRLAVEGELYEKMV